MKKSNKFLLVCTLLGVVFISLFIVCVAISLNNSFDYKILGINALLLSFCLFLIAMIFLTVANILSVRYWKRKGTSISKKQVNKNMRKMFGGEK